MKKVLIVATVLSHIAQFHNPIIRMLKNNGYEVHVAGKNNLFLKNGLYLENIDKIYDLPFDRSPLSFKNIRVAKRLKTIINENNYQLIQCNTPVGGIVTRVAAIEARRSGTKIIYTAHGFHFYKGAPLINWIIYYPIEKVFSFFTDLIITINIEDYNFAKKHFKCKVEHIYGLGVSKKIYRIHSIEESKVFYHKYEIDPNDFNIICIGELNDNKNQIVIIKAIANIINECPNIKLFLAGNGPNENNLKEKVKEYKLEKNIRFLGYTRKLPEIIPICDCIVSCSKREGLGINIIEGMLSGKPAIVSNNRGHRELIEDNINGLIFRIGDYEECGICIKKLYFNDDLYDFLQSNTVKMMKNYEMEEVIKNIRRIYLNL